MGRKKRVVIVGGSFAGRTALRLLKKHFDVTIFESKEYFEYIPSVLRCLVEPDHAFSTLIKQPHDITIATVVHFDENKVRLATGEEVTFDYCLLCCGSHYITPIKPDTETENRVESRLRVLRDEAEKIKLAKKIVVIGGGTVGVELAAELIGSYKSEKEITLITSKQELLDRMPVAAQRYAREWLKSSGAHLIFGEKVVDCRDGGPVTTNTGRQLEADLVYKCLGLASFSHVRPNDLEIESNHASSFKGDTIRVNQHTLQVEGFQNVFACGDCTNTPEEKTAFSAELSAQLVVKNILLLSEEKPLVTYPQAVCQGSHNVPQVACISLYKYSGILQINDFVLTGFIPSLFKVQVEFMQMALAKEQFWALAMWHVMESLSLWLSQYL